jgi:hypothetical protein
MPADEPLYTLDGGRYVPTDHTRGPWDVRAQHGGAPSALVARALEDVAGEGFAIIRLTIELLRPVPLVPLTLAARVAKPGRRSIGVAVVIEADGTPVVEARGVAVRRAGLPVGPDAGPERDELLTPGPESGRRAPFGADYDGPAFHRTGMDVQFVDGGFDKAGPATVWIRLQRPVVDDEEPTGLQRVAAAADFGNGVSWVLPYDRWRFLNADLTVHLSRPPEGEWMGLDALTLLGDEGAGLAESTLYDEAGRLGRGAQSLVVERRPDESPA